MSTIDKALSYIDNGDVERGIDLLNSLKLNCTDDEKYRIAEIYFDLGFANDAKVMLEELLLLYPNEGELLTFLADVLIDLNHEDEAIEVLNTVSKEDPSFPQALLLLADLYEMQGLEEVCEQKLLEAKSILPNEPLIDFALGEFYLSHGYFNKSLMYFIRLVENSETISGVNLNQRIAEAYSSSGEFEKSLQYYQAALEDNVDINLLFGYGFTAYQAGNYQTAIKKLTDLKEIDPEYTSLYLYLAKSYEHEGATTKSLEVVKEGLAVDEYNKELYYYAGKLAISAGENTDAIQYLYEALALDPEYVEAIHTLIELFMIEENYDEVVNTIEEAKKYGLDDLQFAWQTAKAKSKLEMFSDALKHYRLAYTFFNNDIAFLEEYGYFLVEEGLRDEAKTVFSQLLELDPANTEIADMLLQMDY
ncbi:tetratricopeptide repeat protein [Cytobacillus sp. Hm23]